MIEKKKEQQEKEEEGVGTKKKRKKNKKTLSTDSESPTTCGREEVKREGEGEKDGSGRGRGAVACGESKDGTAQIDKLQLTGLAQTPSHSTAEVVGNGGEKNGMANGSDVSGCPSPTDSGIGSVGGAEPVAKEGDCITVVSSVDVELAGTNNGAVAIEKEDSSAGKEVDGRRKKQLHMCACCGSAETVAKSFKRCQK